MVGVAWMLSCILPSPPPSTEACWVGLPWVLAFQGAILGYLGLYRGVWRFASLPDLWNIMRAAALGCLSLLPLKGLFWGSLPWPSLFLYPLLLFFLLGAPRMMYRIWKDQGFRVLKEQGKASRVLILGAGKAGEALVRDMLRQGNYLPVGFLDDKKHLNGARVQGIPVLGVLETLPQVVVDMDVDMVVIAMPSATNVQMQRAVKLCEEAGIPFRTLPPLQDILHKAPRTDVLRQVEIDDLLGREPVSLDWRRISEGLRGKAVLITGGGGSIGAELSRQIARLSPSALILVERHEFNLYSVEMSLRKMASAPPLHLYLGDIRDKTLMRHIMNKHRPQVIFHAAAYKHVPMLEFQAREAALNNVLGTRMLGEMAVAYGVGALVLISTDKAVHPVNAMGATKRLAEMVCQDFDRRSATRFITVRFGNVFGSAGSVVPLFQKQVAEGGPVTVTDPQMTRYFMTIPEACQLIMQSAVMGKGGEVFVLDMGQPINITFLAEQIIRLSGKEPWKDIPIVYTGLRPGEKLEEQLFLCHETLEPTEHSKILLARQGSLDWQKLHETLEALEEQCAHYDEEGVKAFLQERVHALDGLSVEERPRAVVIPMRRAQR
ncbi:MAG: polysaccharide biosynthesis protein [Gammaproteobacteria bacterium]|nr:MAG: polysaccharide biosynthesis protein [Gammaproteobacteria bacterium]